MYSYPYPRPMLTADCVLFARPRTDKEPPTGVERDAGNGGCSDAGEGKGFLLLLVRRGRDPYKGMWALPGGFMEMDETLEACARRELQEETGCAVTAPLVELGSFSRVDRDPRGRTVTVAFMAEVEECPVKGDDDAREARWFALDELPPLAFDHDEIVAAAMARRFGCGSNTAAYNKC